jgi:hypothetical protein
MREGSDVRMVCAAFQRGGVRCAERGERCAFVGCGVECQRDGVRCGVVREESDMRAVCAMCQIGEVRYEGVRCRPVRRGMARC